MKLQVEIGYGNSDSTSLFFFVFFKVSCFECLLTISLIKNVFTTSQITQISRSTLLFSLIHLNYSNLLIIHIYTPNDSITLIFISLHDRIRFFDRRRAPTTGSAHRRAPIEMGIETLRSELQRYRVLGSDRLRSAPLGSDRLLSDPVPPLSLILLYARRGRAEREGRYCYVEKRWKERGG